VIAAPPPEYDLLPKLKSLRIPTLVIYRDHEFIPAGTAEHTVIERGDLVKRVWARRHVILSATNPLIAHHFP
jgi:hypothetical protein